MARIKPKHVRAVAELLQAGAETPEALAKAVIAKVDELRQDDTYFQVVVRIGKDLHVGYGPFSTANEAHKAIGKGALGGGSVGLREIRGVMPLYHPKRVADQEARADEPPAVKGDWAAIKADIEQLHRDGKLRRRK